MKIWIYKLAPYLLLSCVWLVVLIYGVRTHSQSWYFQDENEHLTHAWMMNTQGLILYQDLVTDHQPLPFFSSALLLRVIRYETLFQLTERLRLAMYLGLAMVSILLIWRARWAGMLTGLLIVSLSYYYLGWHVLAESLSAGAVSLLIILVLNRWWPDSQSQSVSLIEVTLFSLGVFWIMFNLLALWPFVGVISLMYLWKLTGKQRLILIGLDVLMTAFLFSIIPLASWFQATISDLWFYFIRIDSGTSWWSPLAFAFYPLLNFRSPDSSIGRFFILSIIILGLSLWWLPGNKSLSLKKNWWKLGLIWLVTTLLNNRVDQAPAGFYVGFHLWPYVGGWSALVSFVMVKAIRALPKYPRQQLLLGCLFGLMIFSSLTWLTEKKDKLNDYYINYDPFQSAANAIMAIKEPGETLLTGPDGAGLINILAEVPLADRQNFHLPWSWRSPQLQREFKQMMSERPPTYVYFQVKDNGYYNYLRPILAQDYLPLIRPDGAVSNIQVRKDKLMSLDDQQLKNLADQSFSFAAQ